MSMLSDVFAAQKLAAKELLESRREIEPNTLIRHLITSVEYEDTLNSIPIDMRISALLLSIQTCLELMDDYNNHILDISPNNVRKIKNRFAILLETCADYIAQVESVMVIDETNEGYKDTPHWVTTETDSPFKTALNIGKSQMVSAAAPLKNDSLSSAASGAQTNVNTTHANGSILVGNNPTVTINNNSQKCNAESRLGKAMGRYSIDSSLIQRIIGGFCGAIINLAAVETELDDNQILFMAKCAAKKHCLKTKAACVLAASLERCKSIGPQSAAIQTWGIDHKSLEDFRRKMFGDGWRIAFTDTGKMSDKWNGIVTKTFRHDSITTWRFKNEIVFRYFLVLCQIFFKSEADSAAFVLSNPSV